MPVTTGALATGGGVVFEGPMDRWFRARDSATGKVLWRVLPPGAGPSTPSMSFTFAASGPPVMWKHVL